MRVGDGRDSSIVVLSRGGVLLKKSNSAPLSTIIDSRWRLGERLAHRLEGDGDLWEILRIASNDGD